MGSCQSTEAAVPQTQKAAAESNRTTTSKLPLKNGATQEKPLSASKTRNGENAYPIDSSEPLCTNLKNPLSSSNAVRGTTNDSGHSYSPGYASGASTPTDSRSLDGSQHGGNRDRANSYNNPKALSHSGSVLGLDSMIEARREEGALSSNVVHIEVPFGKPIEEVYDGIHSGPVLGSGISGLVRLVTHKATKVKYAVKVLDLGLVETEEGLQQLREEIFIMCQLDHPNIVRLEEVYESHTEIYLVQELCFGGELFDRLDEQPDYHYTEGECARLVKQMLCAVRYLHSKGIIHRDMKLENFLFSSTSPDSELKMIDFGLSKHFKFGDVQHEAVGTPYTVAPEVIRGSYDERCDIWAIGVISFLLLSGDPPFGGCGGPEPLLTVRSNILKGFYSFEPKDIWDIVSVQAKQFIKSLLVIEPHKRPTAREAQRHEWLKEWANRGKRAEDKMLSPNVVKALMNFKEFSDMRKLLCEVLSFTLLPDQITDLRKEFEKMDTDGSGEISLSALKQVLLTNAGSGSLGALTEEEVEDIFNAMRVRKSETRIHWHEFIAAGLSQCQVDDRNLRLAFDRLDSDHKGYITFENVMDLMGNDAFQSEDAMRKMWCESMQDCNCNHARICYDDFLLLMKGQTKEIDPIPAKSRRKLSIVQEDASPPHEDVPYVEIDLDKVSGSNIIVLPSGDKVAADGKIIPGIGLINTGSGNSLRDGASTVSVSPPSTPVYGKPMISCLSLSDDLVDGPLSMDEEDGDDLGVLPFRSKNGIGSLTPPESPRRGPADYVTPNTGRHLSPNVPAIDTIMPLPQIPRPDMYTRRRSRSVDDHDIVTGHDDERESIQVSETDIRRLMVFPEHSHDVNIEKLIQDGTKTPLVVSRKLYRAHRQMRLAVIEATKRFEEEQTRRARDMLEKEEGIASHTVGAGLVMRHGLKKQVSSQAVNDWLRKSEEEQAKQIDLATKRGGRGKSRRKKTISDMTGMLSDLHFDLNAEPTNSYELTEGGNDRLPLDQFTERQTLTQLTESDSALNVGALDIDDFPPIREATVPGVFHRTQDPFSTGGRYRTNVPFSPGGI